MDQQKIKIARITPSVNIGSISRTGEQIGQLVIEQGWESYIFHSREGGLSSSQLIKVGNRLSIFLHALIARFFDACGYGSYFATKKLVFDIKKIAPDIIHLHNIHSYDINVKVLFSYLRKANIPVVWTQHDCWAFTGHCAHFIEASCDKWKYGCNHCPKRNSYPKSIFFDGSKRNYNAKKELFTSVPNMTIVSVSDWMKQQVSQSFLAKYPSIRIYNGIDIDTFKPCQKGAQKIREKYNLENKVVLMAVAASWGKGKGFFDYIKLRKELTSDYVIVLVGLPMEMENGLPEGIIRIPRTNSLKELADIYSAADIVLNLSYAESFGKTTPEGLACGVPSIVYNVTASPELVDNKTGIVVEQGDINGIVNAVMKIKSWNKEETISECRSRACLLFDKNKNWMEYINLYNKLLNV